MIAEGVACQIAGEVSPVLPKTGRQLCVGRPAEQIKRAEGYEFPTLHRLDAEIHE